MHLTYLAAALIIAPAAALAQPSPPGAAQSFNLPHAYAGYSQPEITKCTTTGALKRECVVPAMTAGRYLVVAAAAATSTGSNATQALSISLGAQPCVSINPVAFTGKRALKAACAVNLLTDQPINIAANYVVQNATPDAPGPQLILRRIPWTGVVESRPVILPAPKAQPAGK